MTFLDGYSAKLVEYILAISYLVLFVGFWKYIHSPVQQEVRS
jgi:hypothetical protein